MTEQGPQQLELGELGGPLRAGSRLKARYAELRAKYPPTTEWPDKRCYYIARTGDHSPEGYQAEATAGDKVSASRANYDPAVQQYIQQVRKREIDSGALTYSAQDVLADLWAATDMAIGRAPQKKAVVVQERIADPETEETRTQVRVEQIEYEQTDLPTLKGYMEVWMKHFGLIRERLEADVSGSFSDRSDDELRAELARYGLQAAALPEEVPVDDGSADSGSELGAAEELGAGGGSGVGAGGGRDSGAGAAAGAEVKGDAGRGGAASMRGLVAPGRGEDGSRR